MLFDRTEMAELAADREVQAAQAETDAGGHPDGSTERRFATQTAAELRQHADQLRHGINPYEDDTELWIPRRDSH